MKFKFFSLIIILTFIANCASSPDHKQAKIYISSLDSSINQDSEEVASKIIDTWGFHCIKLWNAEDPTLKDVLKENRGRTVFTKQEVNRIFSPKGKYKVMHFNKYLRTEKVSIRTISSTGYSMSKDIGKTREVVYYTFIRIVFRDDKLIHFKVWPRLEIQIS